MMQNINIRRATIDDLPQIVAIFNETVAQKSAHASLEPASVQSRQAWFLAHHDRRPIFVLCDAQDIVGWASFSDFYRLPAYHISAEISLYIAKSHHGRGLGAYLLEFMLKQAGDLGIYTVLALVFSHNTPSLKLFERFGFRSFGVLEKVCDMQDFLADTVILGKHLDLPD